MDLFDRDALEALAHANTERCVSLYMPTAHVEAQLSQNPIRLKNLLRQARQQLKEAGLREADIEALLAPAQPFQESLEAWGTLNEGLAAFFDSSGARFYRIPLQVEELVVTSRRFHLKPLFPLLASNNRFYVLALSKNRVQLYQGTHAGLDEMQVEDMPGSLVEALFYDDPERSLQHHTGNRVGGRSDAIFHGQGVQDEDHRSRPQDALRRFFRQVDHGVFDELHDDSAPLLLAGVEHYLPIYREVNSYPHLIADEIVAGNPDHLSPHQLHGKAWEVIEPLFQQTQQASLAEFERARQTDGLASEDVKEIIPAAVFSRVDTLFVPIGVHLWGLYDPDDNAVTINETQQPGDNDLYDLAAVQTYLHGGTVHALRPENMPVESGLAATFRYPAQVEAVES